MLAEKRGKLARTAAKPGTAGERFSAFITVMYLAQTTGSKAGGVRSHPVGGQRIILKLRLAHLG